jgi:acetoin:2,6-dichlorophenolindophenol oxidoreductase subunit alpha
VVHDRIERGVRIDLLRTMVRIRQMEERIGEAHLRGLTAGSMLHLSVGEEGIAAGVGAAMRDGDLFTTHHRGHGIFIARGADLGRMMAEVFGKVDGYLKGKGGSMHIADIALGHMGANAIVGGNIPISVGGGLSAKLLHPGVISVAFFGDGALQQGVLYESMNLAALWKLPVSFVVVNNQYGMGTKLDRASASMRFVERAETFGLVAREVDGMDVEAVYEAASELLDHTRTRHEASFLLATGYRYYGHGRKDPSPYRTKEEEQVWRDRDPVEAQRSRLVSKGLLGDAEFEEIEADVRRECDDAVSYATASPETPMSELRSDVYVGQAGI